MPKYTEQAEQALSMQDLRAIIHGLKMCGFGFIEEEALEVINQKIAALPSPEELITLVGTPEVLKKMTQQVGEIMRLVELYGKRDGEYKVRFKSRKDLPPRYKVLEWRKNMLNKANTIKLVVRTSSVLDEMGNGELSNVFLKCANAIQNGDITESQFTDAIVRLGKEGYTKEQKQIIAALAPYANPTGVGAGVGDVAGRVKGWFGNVMQTGKDIFRSGLWNQRLQSTIKQVQEVIGELNKASSQATDPSSKKILSQILAKHQEALNALTSANTMATAAATAAPPQTAGVPGAPGAQEMAPYQEVALESYNDKRLGQLYTTIQRELMKRKKTREQQIPMETQPVAATQPATV